MPRAIIRTSINGPSPNTQMRDLGNLLKRASFERIGTGAYEGELQTMSELTEVLRTVLDFLDRMGDEFKVDHFWWYADGTSDLDT